MSIDVKALKERIDPRAYYEKHVRFTSRHGDWWEGHCPFHEDKSPSFGANVVTGQWKCHSCGEGGDVLEFEMKIRNCDFKQAIQNLGGGNVIPFRPASSGSRPAPAARAEDKKETKPIDPAVAERYHQLLLTDERAKSALEFLHKVRGYTDETIERYKLGFEPSCWKDKMPRITFPVFDGQGQLVNIRMYRRITKDEAAKGNAKMLPWQQGYGATRWYPIEAFQEDEIIICEGEPDTLLCRQLGFNAVTQTGGAKTFLAQWAPLFTGKRVRVCYDHDTAGQEGAQKVAEAIARTAAEVKIIELPVLGEHEDFTDWVLKYDGSPEGFRELIESAPVYQLPEGSAAESTAADSEIPLEQQIRELPKDLDWDEKQAAFRRWVTEVARKRPAEQDRLIDLMAVALNMKKTTLRREIKAAEAALKLEPPIPTPLAEPRQDDVVLAQDYHKGVFHYGIWLPTNKNEYVFRLVTSERKLVEVESGDLPRDTRRWSVDAKTPYNVFAYLAGECHVNPEALFDEIEAWFRRYLWYPDERIYPLLAAWTMQSYTFMLFDQTGYLALVGTRGAGKTLLFEVLKQLCFNALHTAVPSDAYVFRSVDADRVTLLIDEADEMKSAPKEPTNSKLEILRSGYRRSGTVGRVEGEDRKRVEFSVYSPKAIANVSGLEDALEDRTIPIPVVRKPARVTMDQHIIRKLRDEYQILRNKLYCFGLEYANQLADIYDRVNIRGRIRDREADIWSGLVTIIRLAKPRMEKPLMDLAAENSQRKNLHEGSESIEGQEVMVLWEIVCNEEPTTIEGHKKWYASTRICDSVRDQLGWESFSATRLANDLVKMKIVDDSADYKRRFPLKYEYTDKNGNVKTRKHKPICYWIRKDRIISAAERYSVPLDGVPGLAEQKKTPETEEDSPF